MKHTCHTGQPQLSRQNWRVVGRTGGDTSSSCASLRVSWLRTSPCVWTSPRLGSLHGQRVVEAGPGIMFRYKVLRQEASLSHLYLFIRARRIVPGGPTGDKVPTPSLPLRQVASLTPVQRPLPQPSRSQENWAEAPPGKGWLQRRFTSCRQSSTALHKLTQQGLGYHGGSSF